MENILKDFAEMFNSKPRRSRRDPYEVESDDLNLYFRFNSDPSGVVTPLSCKNYVKDAVLNGLKCMPSDFEMEVAGDEDFIEVVCMFKDKNMNEDVNNFAFNSKIVSSGKVEVRKTFFIENFDEDDGFVVTTIEPGTYDYRVLDIRGWKPRQLKIDGEWVDVMGECEELEELLSMETETTTVSNIAPTTDYLGHVTNTPGLIIPKDDNENGDKEDLDKKEKARDTSDRNDWVSPLGRLLAGESVRSVIDEMVKHN